MSIPVPMIYSACRTPIGRFLGSLASLSAVELGVIAARSAIERSGVDRSRIDEAIIGNVLSAGLGQAPARQVALGAGLSPSSSALTVNMVCGSGLRAVMLAEASIRAGVSRLLLVGGMESMSRAPHLLTGGREGWKLGDRTIVDSMLLDGLTCSTEAWPMGLAAERTVQQCGLPREALDDYAVESQRRAVKATLDGVFDDEIVTVPVASKRGATIEVRRDESPRPETSRESLAKLLPAFKADGVVTAGNSSTIADGAAMLVVGGEGETRTRGLIPLARIVASAVSGVEPRDLFLAPVSAITEVLLKAGKTIDEIDLFEINEAFASQMLGCMTRLELDPSKVNVFGGAIALGHPIGASGARMLVTLIHALKRLKKRWGLASLCLGGGNAVAMIVERLD